MEHNKQQQQERPHLTLQLITLILLPSTPSRWVVLQPPRASPTEHRVRARRGSLKSFTAAPTLWDIFCYFFFNWDLALAPIFPGPIACIIPGQVAEACTGFSRTSFRSRTTVCPVPASPTLLLRPLSTELPSLWKSDKGMHPDTQKKISDECP